MKKKILSVLLIATMAVSLMACGKEEVEEQSDVTDVVVEEAVETVEESDTFFEDKNTEGKVHSYLTGDWVDEEIGRSRPLAIMIENTKACLPQYAIENASIIYECPVEGSITRLMAIFDDYTGMDRIGNIRSSRPYYVYFASEYEAFYAHAGGNPAAFELIDNGLVENLNGLDGDIGSSFYRSSDAQAPHNFYTSSDGVKKGIATRNYETSYSADYEPHFQFSSNLNTLEDGEACEAVKMYFFYNEPYFIYNADEKVYYRYQFGGKQIDASTGNQVAATNIIIQNSTWFEYTGSEYIGFDLPNNSGDGWFISNGKKVPITWTKGEDTEVTHYYYENGEEIKLNIGTTWIEVCQDTYADQNQFFASSSDLK